MPVPRVDWGTLAKWQAGNLWWRCASTDRKRRCHHRRPRPVRLAQMARYAIKIRAGPFPGFGRPRISDLVRRFGQGRPSLKPVALASRAGALALGESDAVEGRPAWMVPEWSRRPQSFRRCAARVPRQLSETAELAARPTDRLCLLRMRPRRLIRARHSAESDRRRFHPLIATIVIVRFANSSSVKCYRAPWNTSSGACPSPIRAMASVQAKAARSRSV